MSLIGQATGFPPGLKSSPQYITPTPPGFKGPDAVELEVRGLFAEPGGFDVPANDAVGVAVAAVRLKTKRTSTKSKPRPNGR